MVRVEDGIVADEMEFVCAVIAVHVEAKQTNKVAVYFPGIGKISHCFSGNVVYGQRLFINNVFGERLDVVLECFGLLSFDFNGSGQLDKAGLRVGDAGGFDININLW